MLSIAIWVGGCTCLRAWRDFSIGTTARQFWYAPMVPASAAEDMIRFMVLHLVKIGLLGTVVGVLSDTDGIFRCRCRCRSW